MKPEILLYTDTHEWVQVDRSAGEPIATIGITAFAVKQLTDLVYIDLPRVGDQVSQGKEFGEIESVKSVSSLYSPVTGEVVEVNSALLEDLDALARDPYGEGWLIKVKLSDESSLARLMDYETYLNRCTGGDHRHGHRQAPARLRVPRADGVFPADGARGADDRADRD